MKRFLVHFDHGYDYEKNNLDIRGPSMMRREETSVSFAANGTTYEGWTAFGERTKCQKMLMVFRFWRDYFVYNHGYRDGFEWDWVRRFDENILEWKSTKYN